MANTEASEVRSGMFAPPQCPADLLMVDRGGGHRSSGAGLTTDMEHQAEQVLGNFSA